MGRPRYIKMKRDRLTGEFSVALKAFIGRRWRARETRRSPADMHIAIAAMQVRQEAADLAGSHEKARSWFENARLPVFDNKTPEELVSEGRADDLRRYMRSLKAGYAG